MSFYESIAVEYDFVIENGKLGQRRGIVCITFDHRARSLYRQSHVEESFFARVVIHGIRREIVYHQRRTQLAVLENDLYLRCHFFSEIFFGNADRDEYTAVFINSDFVDTVRNAVVEC